MQLKHSPQITQMVADLEKDILPQINANKHESEFVYARF